MCPFEIDLKGICSISLQEFCNFKIAIGLESRGKRIYSKKKKKTKKPKSKEQNKEMMKKEDRERRR